MNKQHIQHSIQEASNVIGTTWPLYSFVTSNPLSGYEKLPFDKAVNHAKELLNARVFPEAWVYRQAWQQGDIDANQVQTLLKEQGFSHTPEECLTILEAQTVKTTKNAYHDLDRIMVKWLSAFMDEGLAEWDMPEKEKGFYHAWRNLAPYDSELNIKARKDIPATAIEVIASLEENIAEEDLTKLLTFHLAALPGWTGYINHRTTSNSLWQQKYPITLEDYLAVRLYIAQHLKMVLLPKEESTKKDDTVAQLQYILLKAWEKSWQNQLIHTLESQSKSSKEQANTPTPDAQMVFCIDTRSELIRRNVESKGNYETFGYAGFFGIAMDYTSMEDGLTRKSCPPIVSSAYNVCETPQQDTHEKHEAHQRKIGENNFWQYFLKRMKNMLPSAFGYVEGSGIFYGLATFARTITPGYSYRLKTKNTTAHEAIYQPKIEVAHTHTHDDAGISLAEKVAIVKSAFDLTGWKNFAPIVLFVGHGSHSANNPFGSSLDCGACAASPGRHNARMLAKLANVPEVRHELAVEHQLVIPTNTVFVGAEHNTTTDEITIFDAEVPDTHHKQLYKIKVDLNKAQQTATQERLGTTNNSIAKAEKKANNWGETRPEWGLAKNAGFIIAPRELTKNVHLGSRCFLHSYDWKMDTQGKALEGILQGPMVVTQWINNHYYFSTVDNDTFGGGTKITHNITGKFGVVQGNGGDLKMGLPLQSVNQADKEMYHQPLRLSVLVQAPITRIQEILERNEHLKTLLDNEWIYLMVMDPTKENNITKYQKNMKWDAAIHPTVEKEKTAEHANTRELEEVLS